MATNDSVSRPRKMPASTRKVVKELFLPDIAPTSTADIVVPVDVDEASGRLWQARAARGPGVSGGPKRTRTAYFYGGGFYPFGRTWGGAFARTKTCPIAPPPPSVCVPGDPASPCPSVAPGTPGGPGSLP